MSFSIVTGNGFQTNAQRGHNDGTFGKTNGVAGFYNTGYTLLNNFKYDLTLKYRSVSGITIAATPTEWDTKMPPDWETVDNMYETPFYFGTLPNNNSNCILTGTTIYCFSAYINGYYENKYVFPKHLAFFINTLNDSDGQWLEIDQVNLYHVYPPNSPMCSTISITNISYSGLTLNGIVNPYGLSTNAYFHVDIMDSQQISNDYNCSENPMLSYLTNFNVNKYITFSSYGKILNATMYATNSQGSCTGNTVHIYTPNTPTMEIETSNDNYPINFSVTGVTIRAAIKNYWIPTSYIFEWGTSSGSYTQTTIVTGSTNIGTWNNSLLTGYTNTWDHVSVNLTGLTVDNIYYYRLKATNDIGTVYTSEYQVRPIPLGYYWASQGGLFVYPLNSNLYNNAHGVIIAMSDISAGSTWGCSGTAIGTSYLIGAGLNNTNAIVSGCATVGIAAELCYNLSMSGFTDWFLPSSFELFASRLYTGILGISDSVEYWSSTESGFPASPSFSSLTVYFTSGNAITSNEYKYLSYKVRPARYF